MTTTLQVPAFGSTAGEQRNDAPLGAATWIVISEPAMPGAGVTVPEIVIGVPAVAGYVAKSVCTVTVQAAPNERNDVESTNTKAIAVTQDTIDNFLFKFFTFSNGRVHDRLVDVYYMFAIHQDSSLEKMTMSFDFLMSSYDAIISVWTDNLVL